MGSCFSALFSVQVGRVPMYRKVYYYFQKIQNSMKSAVNQITPISKQEPNFQFLQPSYHLNLNFQERQFKKQRTQKQKAGKKIENKKIQLQQHQWSKEELRQLFTSYNKIGSQWKLISEKVPNRSPNSLKNRFYTAIRNLVKILFRELGSKCPRLQGEIPSRELSRLYDARENYSHLPLLIPNILEAIDFCLESHKISQVAQKHESEIIQAYRVIYRQRQRNEVEIVEKQKKNKFGMPYMQDRDRPQLTNYLQGWQQSQLLMSSQNHLVYFLNPVNYAMQFLP